MDEIGQNRVGKLAKQIEALVTGGELPPGSKLDEQILAQRFEVSRTPVREALRQLASTGLIELRPNRGAFVTIVTPERLEEMFVAMAELEATCARLAAMSMTPVERRGLQRLHERMAEMVARDLFEDFVEANETFHALVYRGAHNSLLEEATIALRRRVAAYRRAQFRTAGRLARSHAEHDAVVKAIVSGEPARAHATMLHHVDLVGASFEKLLATAGAAPPVRTAEGREP
ncbi:GntR family transcriptional regulator [Phenylobacterium sp.]|jgi:DNA-binding GntR family transcriptional regulator|uniref:GntR family transcriptional regulator n=1 Tax=Phenylobacterium sp. TaxID=1871053 RepID=UPI002F42DBFF